MSTNPLTAWSTQGSACRGTSAARATSVALAVFLLLIGVMMPAVAGNHGDSPTKVWVCKMVGQPGDAVPAPGKNPLEVSTNSEDAENGFNDAHPSFVVDGPEVDCHGAVGPDPEVGSLTITKTVEGDGAPSRQFVFTVDCDDDTANATGINLGHDGEHTIDDIGLGECTITENDPGANWSTTANDTDGRSTTVTIEDGETTTATFINTYTATEVGGVAFEFGARCANETTMLDYEVVPADEGATILLRLFDGTTPLGDAIDISDADARKSSLVWPEEDGSPVETVTVVVTSGTETIEPQDVAFVDCTDEREPQDPPGPPTQTPPDPPTQRPSQEQPQETEVRGVSRERAEVEVLGVTEEREVEVLGVTEELPRTGASLLGIALAGLLSLGLGGSLLGTRRRRG